MTTMMETPERVDYDVDPSAVPSSMEAYRAVSRLAVSCMVLAIVSVVLLPFAEMLVVPALAALLGILALRSIRRYPDELTGKTIAWVGTIVSLLVLIGGSAGHAYLYATEVPEGYERISFGIFKPDRRRPQEIIPEEALAMDGKKVFIKGYIHPGVDGLGPVHEFVLVPDMGTCCFGGQPELWDMMAVVTSPEDATQYNRQKRKLAGTLKVDKKLKNVQGLGGVVYLLEADFVD
jgi:hypothetical protein